MSAASALLRQAQVRHQPGGTRQKERLDLRRIQPRELGLIAFDEAPSATCAALSHHRDARAAERIHIAENGAFGNFQAFGEVAGGHAAVHLKQEKDGKQAVGAHIETLAMKHDKGCQESPAILLAMKTLAMKPLKDKIAVVAGSSRGAGRGIALALGDAGATVYVAARTSRVGPKPADSAPGTVEDTAGEVTARGGRGIPVCADLGNEAASRRPVPARGTGARPARPDG